MPEIEPVKKGLGVGNTDDSDSPDDESLSDVLRAAVEGQSAAVGGKGSESSAVGKVAGTRSSRYSGGCSGDSQDTASDAHKLSHSCSSSSQGNGTGSAETCAERRMRVRHTSGSKGSGSGGGSGGGAAGGDRSGGGESSGGGGSGDGGGGGKRHVVIEDELGVRARNRTGKREAGAARDARARGSVAARGSSGDSHGVAAEGGKKRQASKGDNSRSTNTGGDATKTGTKKPGRLSTSIMPSPLKVTLKTGHRLYITRSASATAVSSTNYHLYTTTI